MRYVYRERERERELAERTMSQSVPPCIMDSAEYKPMARGLADALIG